jgi:lysyl-tRNA synthetase, class II
METDKQSEYEERVRKLSELRRLSINPYPAGVKRTHEIGPVLAGFKELESKAEKITVAGRLRSKRGHGNLTFAHLEDSSGRIQVAFSKNETGGEKYKIFQKLIDVGDFLSVHGRLFTTQKGEPSLMAEKFDLLTKALRPLPDKWHGLKDEEERLRKRYLDIIFNPQTRDLIVKKEKFWRTVRDFLRARGFIEVETPVLEITAGGADARPFKTWHNALGTDVYLRISMGELWQKRLMVAGLEKTFEIGRQFRNEGMDAEHLQDYTQLEFYQAYADYRDGMKLVEALFCHAAKETFGTLKFEINGFTVDLGSKWAEYDYAATVMKFTGVDINRTTIGQIEAKLKDLKVIYDRKGFNITRAIDNLWKYCRKKIAGPGFLVGVPVVVSPLAKTDEKNPRVAERFQPIIGGTEVGNGYSELNDPLEQTNRFREQKKLRDAGDDEAQMTDSEFVEALEYGMPPTCGFGMSERAFALLAGKSVRECQIFPLMKPR